MQCTCVFGALPELGTGSGFKNFNVSIYTLSPREIYSSAQLASWEPQIARTKLRQTLLAHLQYSTFSTHRPALQCLCHDSISKRCQQHQHSIVCLPSTSSYSFPACEVMLEFPVTIANGEIEFTRGFLVFQSSSTVLFHHLLRNIRAGCNVRPQLVDSWWGRLSRIFRTGLCIKPERGPLAQVTFSKTFSWILGIAHTKHPQTYLAELKKAYYRIPCEKLWGILQEYCGWKTASGGHDNFLLIRRLCSRIRIGISRPFSS